MSDAEYERQQVCYEQNFEQARSLNVQMNHVPVLAMTLTDLDQTGLRLLFAPFPDMKLTEIWVSTGEGTHQGKDEWLNTISLKIPERGGQ